MKIMIRTDGGHVMGLGHIIRCLSLAIMLTDEFRISFYLKDAGDTLLSIIRDKKIDVRPIQDEETFFSDVTEGTIVVLDGYHFNTAYQQRIRSLGAKLVCIDDLHDKHFVADAIINQAPGVDRKRYSAELYTQFYLGTDFALLRPSFQKVASLKRKIKKLRKALICFGGSDSKNLTLPTVKTLMSYQAFEELIVITGSSYANAERLMTTVSSDERIRHVHDASEEEMVRCFLDCQLAVVPSSGILFEAIACKTPVISGYYIDNQMGIYEGFLNHGVFYDAVDFSTASLRRALEEAFQGDPNKQIERQAACIDGRSGERYIDIFHKLQP